jgi:hypothetical protein
VQRVNAGMRDFPGPVGVRNQARVHLWLKQRFGAGHAPLSRLSLRPCLGRASGNGWALGHRCPIWPRRSFQPRDPSQQSPSQRRIIGCESGRRSSSSRGKWEACRAGQDQRSDREPRQA